MLPTSIILPHVTQVIFFPVSIIALLFSSKSCPSLCNPWTADEVPSPSFTNLPEFAQTHVHWVNDAIQPSHILLTPSPPVLKISHHHGLFPMSRFFASHGQSIGASASATLLPTINAGDLGSIPRLGRSPGEEKGYPLQYSGLENFMDCMYSP